MAEKEINKSEEIRKTATHMKEKGESPRPVLIIESLKKQGIVVSSPQVSIDSPSSIVSRISPMPNSPITAIRKSKPLSNWGKPKVSRSWPVI